MLIAVTDTHALAWHILGQDRKLGRRSLKLFREADQGKAHILIPVIVVFEVIHLVELGKIHGLDVRKFIADLGKAENYSIADMTLTVVEKSRQLPSTLEFFDRLIAATALALELPLISKDQMIAELGLVEVIWH
jgi:PIN domain nuclease of toxin-antitoxin system